MARQVVVDLIGNSKGYTKATNEAIKSTKTLGDRLKDLDKRVSAVSGKGGLTGAILGGVGVGAGIGIYSTVARGISTVVDYMRDATKAASDQAEATSKVSVVFGTQARVIQQWASTSSRAMGMSKTAALDAAGSLGNLFDGMGLTADASVDMSKKIVQLAADLGSFNNVSTDEALVALKAGLVGETEPMRRFGVAMNATAVETKAVAMGLAQVVKIGGKSKTVISESAKVQARYALILEGTTNAQGDFARTADGMANSQKTLDSAMEDLSAEVGKFLVGPATDLLRFFTMLATGSRTTGGAIQEFLNEQRRLRGEVTQGQDPIEGLTALLVAYAQATDDTKTISAEAAKEFMWLGRMAGQTAQDVMDLWKFFREGGSSVEETTRKVREFLLSVVLVGERSSVTTPLLSEGWSDALGIVRDEAALTTGALDSLVRAVDNSVGMSLRTLADAKEPWKQAFQQLAAWVKDPFKPAKLEDWIEARVKAMLRKADQAAANGEEGLARRWRKAARLMKNPVMRALLDIGVGVEQALGMMALVKSAGRGLRASASSWFNVFGNDGDGNKKTNKKGNGGDSPHQPSTGKNARGTSNWRGGWSWVGEEGPELMRLPRGTAIKSNPESMRMAGGGTTIVVNVNVPPTANMADVGREITRALNAYRQGGGQAAMKSAIGVA